MFKRFRSRRVSEDVRAQYRETHLSMDDFIWPVFLVPGENVRESVSSLTEVYRYSGDTLIAELHDLVPRGLKSIVLFAVPKVKGVDQAFDENGIIQHAIPSIKEHFPDLEIITDVCLCSYTSDGHCHVGDNDATCDILAKIALSHARAGADVVAPSDMMDGRVLIIRQALDAAGFTHIPILSYAAKYASYFYGPFREAADCAPAKGDRKTYQMDPPNAREAIDEISADIEEGAAQIMIKPALSYLDIIARARAGISIPIVAYNVSGEYQMLRLAVAHGVAKPEAITETLISIKRAGADRIVSYFTPDILRGKIRL